MATAAQIEANRLNSQKSTGPRTEEGKNRSRCNALDHGCRANIMVLPTEVFGEYEQEFRAWELSLKPRNPTEEFLVTRIAKLAWQGKRIDRAQTARLSTRIHQGGIEEDEREDEHVLELGQKLFQDACGPLALQLQHDISDLRADGESFRISDYSVLEDQPLRLVHCLQTTATGCQWLLDRWSELRGLLTNGIPWLSSDKLKAVRLLGRHPIDALDDLAVAQVYLASHVLLNQDVEPFQEIFTELSPQEAGVYRNLLRLRQYDSLVPKDAAAARAVLLDIVNRAASRVQAKADELNELAELNAPYTANRLSWDDTPEGERLRRYELTCDRAWNRAFDLFMKIRQSGGELDLATFARLGRSLPFDNIDRIDQRARTVASVITTPAEPVQPTEPPIEAKVETEKAPNEANSGVQAVRHERPDSPKDHRIDTAQLDRKPGGIGIAGKAKSHPVLEHVLRGRNPNLMNLSSIFDK
jgi:hypothetical protein